MPRAYLGAGGPGFESPHSDHLSQKNRLKRRFFCVFCSIFAFGVIAVLWWFKGQKSGGSMSEDSRWNRQNPDPPLIGVFIPKFHLTLKERNSHWKEWIIRRKMTAPDDASCWPSCHSCHIFITWQESDSESDIGSSQIAFQQESAEVGKSIDIITIPDGEIIKITKNERVFSSLAHFLSEFLQLHTHFPFSGRMYPAPGPYFFVYATQFLRPSTEVIQPAIAPQAGRNFF